MSGELPPSEETLDIYVVANKSLAQWHQWLNRNPDTGADESHLRTPGSRYGSTAGDVAWYSIAAGLAYIEHASYDNMRIAFETALDIYQHLVVNDNSEVAEFIVDNWHIVPQCLRDVLGGEEDIRELTSRGD